MWKIQPGQQAARAPERLLQGDWALIGCCVTGAMRWQPREPQEACFIRWFVLHPISTPRSKSVSSKWTMTPRNLCLAWLYNSIFKPNFVAIQDIRALTRPKKFWSMPSSLFSVYFMKLHGGMKRKYHECVDTATTTLNVINAVYE